MATLQVQIVTYGQAGLDRLSAHRHPQIDGVRWLVSCQNPDGPVSIPPDLDSREDFTFVFHADCGVIRNRNHALDATDPSAAIILLGDDDADYNEEGIRALVEAFERHPSAGIMCFRYRCLGRYVKPYGDGEFDLASPPKGWYPGAIEIAFRRSALGDIRFNENLALLSDKIQAGEDTVFFTDMMRRTSGLGIPVDLCEHNNPGTGERMGHDPEFIKLHGACMTHIKPFSWPLRLVAHAWRSPVPTLFYLRHAFEGARLARRLKIFK